jgi:glucokinase
MILAGDVGGTKTLLGVFTRGEPRPRLLTFRAYPTNSFDSFSAILDAFARDLGDPFNVEAAAIGVAGPVIGGRATLTNIAWDISCGELSARLVTPRVALLNDLEAMGTSIDVLTPDELLVLQEGVVRDEGNGAVIAAGTGLGVAFLHRVGRRLRPVPSESGHADFAARTDAEIALLLMLRGELGRAEVEDVLCGPGLLNVYRFTHRGEPCSTIAGLPAADAPAAVSEAALAGTCGRCVEALSMFVTAYGAEAGNVALRGVATAGVYIGGGIAPKILPALQDGRFIDAFRDKGKMRELVSKVPVKVILNAEAGLLGAAVAAQELTERAESPDATRRHGATKTHGGHR